ncbi:hypothetical protein D9M68_162450 [compost metagenome]
MAGIRGAGGKAPSGNCHLGCCNWQGERNLSEANAMSHMFGYTAIDDLTLRGLQKLHRQWFLGK